MWKATSLGPLTSWVSVGALCEPRWPYTANEHSLGGEMFQSMQRGPPAKIRTQYSTHKYKCRERVHSNRQIARLSGVHRETVGVKL